MASTMIWKQQISNTILKKRAEQPNEKSTLLAIMKKRTISKISRT